MAAIALTAGPSMDAPLARGRALRPALSPHAALGWLRLARCLQLLAVSRAMRSVVVEAGEQVGSEDAQLWVVRSGTAVRLGNGRSKVRHITACHHRVSLSKEDRCSRVVVVYTRPQEEQPEEEEGHVLGPRSCLSSEEEGGPWQVRALTRLEVGSTLLPGRQAGLLLSSPLMVLHAPAVLLPVSFRGPGAAGSITSEQPE